MIEGGLVSVYMGHQWEEGCEQDKYGYVSVHLRVFGTKTNHLSLPTMLSKYSMYLTLQRRTGLWLCLEKKDCGD
jgi:hypothetical protein